MSKSAATFLENRGYGCSQVEDGTLWYVVAPFIPPTAPPAPAVPPKVEPTRVGRYYQPHELEHLASKIKQQEERV